VNPATHPALPRIDAPWYRKLGEEMNPSYVFPGLEMEKVNLRVFMRGKYRAIIDNLVGTVLSAAFLPIRHLYACDRNLPFLISNGLGFGDQVGAMGRLWSFVVFSVHGDGLKVGVGEWTC
jgi:hypothetical protein